MRYGTIFPQLIQWLRKEWDFKLKNLFNYWRESSRQVVMRATLF